MESESEYFKNRKEAHEWLVEQGYKISQGKFYTDCKKKAFPFVNKDGSVSKYQVMEYGLSLHEEQTPDLSAIERSEHLHRKERADAEMAEIKVERMRREEDSLWLHADNAWSAVAALVGKLRDSIRHHLYVNQNEIVLTAGGEQERSPEVFEMLNGVVDDAFNEVAGESIDVEFEKSGN